MIRDIDGALAYELTWVQIDQWARAKGLTYMRRKNTLRDAGFRGHAGLCVYRAPKKQRCRVDKYQIPRYKV